MKKSTLSKLFTIVSIAIMSGCSSAPKEEHSGFDISQISCGTPPENTKFSGATVYLQKESLNGNGDVKTLTKKNYQVSGYLNEGELTNKDNPFIVMSNKLQEYYIDQVDIKSIDGIEKADFKPAQVEYGIDLTAWVNKKNDRIFFNMKDVELNSIHKINMNGYTIGQPETSEVELSSDMSFGEVSEHVFTLSPTNPPLSMNIENTRESRSYELIACPIYLPLHSSISK